MHPAHTSHPGTAAQSAARVSDLQSRAGYLLARAVQRSQRTSGVQLPVDFLRASSTVAPPLARLLQGGRGGEVRLKLYLTLMLVATKAPYRIDQAIPARVWAEMLELPDPERSGARRVTDALTWLAEHDFLRLKKVTGAPPGIRLRSASGDGGRAARPRVRYARIPLGLWREGWINSLSGRGLAVLLALLDLQGGRRPEEPPSMNAQERMRYGLSRDTWTRAEKELNELGLLTVTKRPQGADFDWRRVRNCYWIDTQRLNTPPPAP